MSVQQLKQRAKAARNEVAGRRVGSAVCRARSLACTAPPGKERRSTLRSLSTSACSRSVCALARWLGAVHGLLARSPVDRHRAAMWAGCTCIFLCSHLVGRRPLLPSGHRSGQQRTVSITMGSKKTSFVPYTIAGEGTPMFPLPGERDAVGVHKKHYPDGCVASKLSKAKADSALLRRYLPSVDLNFPGLRVLHLDPPVLIVDDFFSPEAVSYTHLRAHETPEHASRMPSSA